MYYPPARPCGIPHVIVLAISFIIIFFNGFPHFLINLRYGQKYYFILKFIIFYFLVTSTLWILHSHSLTSSLTVLDPRLTLSSKISPSGSRVAHEGFNLGTEWLWIQKCEWLDRESVYLDPEDVSEEVKRVWIRTQNTIKRFPKTFTPNNSNSNWNWGVRKS